MATNLERWEQGAALKPGEVIPSWSNRGDYPAKLTLPLQEYAEPSKARRADGYCISTAMPASVSLGFTSGALGGPGDCPCNVK